MIAHVCNILSLLMVIVIVICYDIGWRPAFKNYSFLYDDCHLIPIIVMLFMASLLRSCIERDSLVP